MRIFVGVYSDVWIRICSCRIWQLRDEVYWWRPPIARENLRKSSEWGLCLWIYTAKKCVSSVKENSQGTQEGQVTSCVRNLGSDAFFKTNGFSAIE